MSSDKMASVQQPLLSLDLGVSSESGPSVMSVEMNKKDLEDMISALEAANKVNLYLFSVCPYIYFIGFRACDDLSVADTGGGG